VVVHDQAGDLGLALLGLFRHGQRIVFGWSDRERELLRWSLRFEADCAPVVDTEFAGERRDLAPNRLRFLGTEICPPSVQPAVVGEQFRPVLGQVLEEVLAGAGPQEEEIRPDTRRAGRAGGLDDIAELFGPIRYPREDRRYMEDYADAKAAVARKVIARA
jgi:hypothetical protein